MGKFKRLGKVEGKKETDAVTKHFNTPQPLVDQTKRENDNRFADGKTVPAVYPNSMIESSKPSDSPEKEESVFQKPPEHIPPPPVRPQQAQSASAKPPQLPQAAKTADASGTQNLNALIAGLNDMSKRLANVELYLKTSLRETLQQKDEMAAQQSKQIERLNGEVNELKRAASKGVSEEQVDKKLEEAGDKMLDTVGDLLEEELGNVEQKLSEKIGLVDNKVNELRNGILNAKETAEKLDEVVSALNDLGSDAAELESRIALIESALENLHKNFDSFLASLSFISEQIRNNKKGENNE